MPQSNGLIMPGIAKWWSINVVVAMAVLIPAIAGFAASSLAHGIHEGDQSYIQGLSGPNIAPFIYLGAKHMVTGYDHLLFLFGVIFFLYRLKDVGLYVSLFALGHSTTLLLGVYYNTNANPYLIDAIIGVSVIYKALDNLGVFQKWLKVQPSAKAATLIFGFFHGFGLATKLQDLAISPDGLLVNLISFNVGVEIGQVLALSAILIAMGYWRRTVSFRRDARAANLVLMLAGIILTGYQLMLWLEPTGLSLAFLAWNKA